MTALTIKERAKVNAALCIIHDNRADAGAVTEVARNAIAGGLTAAAAYERALNGFVAENPIFAPAISKVIQLVGASSPQTVAKYDRALTEYIETGSNEALTALAPTIAKDSIALAIHNGEMTEADLANGGLAMALGFDPGPVLQEAYAAIEPARTGPLQESSAPASIGDSQVSAVAGPGYVAPRAQREWAGVARTGFAAVPSVSHGLTPNAAREAERASAVSSGRAIFDEAASNA